MLAMQLLYLNGANYVYAENALFKTNAFSRENWEDKFCADNRAYLREFYDYTVRYPREGVLQREMAVIYGNNEYFMWHYDNRMAELGENGDWDAKLWGKWEDNSHHVCWRAVDVWLPPASDQHSVESPVNVELFSGTPYGAVDVIPYDSDYSKYKTMALLGWNTYEAGFSGKLYSYVNNGGNLFVSYCHLNTTDRNDMPMSFAEDKEYFALLGTSTDGFAKINGTIILDDGSVIKNEEKTNIVICNPDDAQIIAHDDTGTVIAWSRKIGDGTLYFANFSDYNCNDARMNVMKYIMKKIGDETASFICDNSDFAYTARKLDNGSTVIDLLNVCSNGKEPQSYTLTANNGEIIAQGEAYPCQIQKIVF